MEGKICIKVTIHEGEKRTIQFQKNSVSLLLLSYCSGMEEKKIRWLGVQVIQQNQFV